MSEYLERRWQQSGALDFDVLLSSLGGGERRSAEYTGTKALMIAILEDGIRSYLSRAASVRAEAEFWVHCGRRNFPFAFNVICDTLGLEPDAVVNAMQRLREQGVSPRRAIRRSRPNVRRNGKIRLRTRRKTAQGSGGPKVAAAPGQPVWLEEPVVPAASTSPEPAAA
jgi:hypothetical protein